MLDLCHQKTASEKPTLYFFRVTSVFSKKKKFLEICSRYSYKIPLVLLGRSVRSNLPRSSHKDIKEKLYIRSKSRKRLVWSIEDVSAELKADKDVIQGTWWMGSKTHLFGAQGGCSVRCQSGGQNVVVGATIMKFYL